MYSMVSIINKTVFWEGESEDRGTGEREQSGGGGGESVAAGTGGY